MGAGYEVTPVLPSDFAVKLTPEQVLDTRVVLRGSDHVQQVYIKWNNLPTSLATWEDYEMLCQEFPRAVAWGQAAFQGGGDVSTVSHLAPVTTEALEDDGEAGSGPRRGTWVKKLNPHYDAETWVRK